MATLPTPESSDQGELIDVFSTRQDSEAMVIQGLLESNGIESLISAEVGPQDILPMGTVVVRVAPESAARARQVIAEAQKVSDLDMLDQSEANAGPSEAV